ncbi:hypothetical protein JD844_021761, partial [Phrynosoma platyrhinos]
EMSGDSSSTIDLCVANDMSLSTDFSEDDIISITFEVCSTKETGVAPASTFIKYLADVTGHSHENSKLLLLYNMLDPKRQNVHIDKETFHTVMKKWIAICYQDWTCDLNSSIEEIKYTNQRMAEQLHGMQKVMEASEETYLQLTDDIADLRDRKKGVESVTRLISLEEELKEKMGHSLVNILQILANICPFLKSWDKALKRLETFLEDPQLLVQSAW